MRKHVLLIVTVSCVALPARAAEEGWISLIKDDKLTGWEAGGGEQSFSVKDGTLTVNGTGQIVYWPDPGAPGLDLQNFELRAEVLTRPGGRAGLTFHLSGSDPRSSGGIEVRVDNSYGQPAPGRPLLKTGSLLWLRPVVKSVAPNDRWFSMHVTVQGRRVQVKTDDKLVTDYLAPEDTAPVPRLRRGTVAIRGHGGVVQMRKLEVKPLPDAAPSKPAPFDPTDAELARLRDLGFSLVDSHIHFQQSLTFEDVTAWSWKTGIGPGIAVSCGKGMFIADDKAADAFLKSAQNAPFFVGMKVEDREWTKRFSPATVARFDYVMADAVSLTDSNGRRTRLSVKEEVNVADPQAFMDLLVKNIETILDSEPVDIYANPTYLPEAIAKDYERLWTTERMKRVVAALARNGVALEINDHLRLPGPALIKQARRAGVKFALGGGKPNLVPLAKRGLGGAGRLEYCQKMIQACALTPEDLWSPKPPGKKPIQMRKR